MIHHHQRVEPGVLGLFGLPGDMTEQLVRPNAGVGERGNLVSQGGHHFSDQDQIAKGSREIGAQNRADRMYGDTTRLTPHATGNLLLVNSEVLRAPASSAQDLIYMGRRNRDGQQCRRSDA